MKHAKRMVLDPEDVLNRYEQKQKIETSPITSNMMRQDTAMSEILQSTDMSDVEKTEIVQCEHGKLSEFEVTEG
jgi:hypothetical protein